MPQIIPSRAEPPDADDQPLDPRLDALSGAIVDGEPVSWASPEAESELSAAFQIIADVAGLHRSLAEDSEPSSPEVPQLPWHAGSLILTRSLGRGSFGEVYRAWDTRLHRDVAVKLLFRPPAGHLETPLLEEGRLAARVRHPHVVTVYGIENIAGRVALITEYLAGESLAAIIATSGPLGPEAVRAIGLALCDALQAVHDAGLLHCDLKPQNVIREASGRIVLTDFGAGQHSALSTRRLAGTPLYLAPEVLAGQAPSVASDVYSLGVLLFYAVTGAHPVAGGTLDEIRAAQSRREKGERLSRRLLPQPLAAAVGRAIAVDPANRFSSAREFRAALAASTPRRRGAARSALPAAALIALTIGLGWYARTAARPVPDLAGASAESVSLPPAVQIGGPSRDGRFFLSVTTDTKDTYTVQRRDLRSGHVVSLAEGRLTAGAPLAAIPSRDGTRIAVAWSAPRRAGGPGAPGFSLRVIHAGDALPQNAVEPVVSRSILDVPQGGLLLPVEWTAAGDAVLCLVHQPDGLVELVVAHTNAVDRQVVQTFRGPVPRRASLSPDGRFVAYDYPADGRSGQRDLLVVGTSHGQQPRVVIADRADDAYPMWTPDGSGLIFSREERGETSTWYVPLGDGQRRAAGQKIASGAAGILPIGLTSSGDLYYYHRTRRHEVQVARLAGFAPLPASAKAIALPGAMDADNPVWSPDGNTLAIAARRGWSIFNAAPSVLLWDRNSGRVRELEPELAFFGGAQMRWAPDGRGVLIRGKGVHGYWGYYRVELESGTTAPLRLGHPRGHEGSLGAAVEWGLDDRTIIHTRPTIGIVEYDLVTESEHVLVPIHGIDFISGMAVDRTHNRLAFSRWNAETKKTGLYLWSRAQGVTTLLEQTDAGPIAFKDWLPGDRILYALGTPEGRRLYTIDLPTGRRADLGRPVPILERSSVSAHPDGDAIAYATGQSSWEVRVIRALLR